MIKYRIILGQDGDDFIYAQGFSTEKKALEVAQKIILQPMAYYRIEPYYDG